MKDISSVLYVSQEQQEALKEILKPYYDGFNKTTEAADAEGSMKFMHPQAVIVKTNDYSTFGEIDLTNLFVKWYGAMGPYIFHRTDEKYSGSGDYIVVESKMSLLRKDKDTVNGEVMHIWKKEKDQWLIFYEQYNV